MTDAAPAVDVAGGDMFADMSDVREAGVSDSSDAADATDAAWPSDFVAVAPCLDPGSYVTTSLSISTPGNAYSPACLRVAAGSSVSIEASVTHPLEPRPGGSAGNPIPSQTSNATVVFTTPGFYPFLCPEHVDQGMIGVIWVTAP